MNTADRCCGVSVTSSAHLRAPMNFDDPNFHHRPYDAQVAYDQSKTANILFAVEATKRCIDHDWKGLAGGTRQSP